MAWFPCSVSDINKADRTDLTNIIIVGSTNNTGASIPIGTFFYLNNVMVKSIAVIANGDTLTENTNYIVANNSVNDINAYVDLTITRTENTLVDATSLGRCLAYKRGRINGFYCNLQIAGGITTNDFVEIGRISGWIGVHKLLNNIVCQSSTYGMIVLQIETDGTISIYSPMPTVNGFYRFNCLMV